MSDVMVDVRGVHKSFGPLEVLRGVDLQVRAGEVTVILGPSGSGKSTLLRTINHLEKVNSGWISIDGELIGYRRSGDKLHELREKDVLRQRTHIGFVFQNFNLFPHLTVSASPTRGPPIHGSCPAGSSSASPSPAHSPSNPRCSSSTSPPRPSTRNWSAKSWTSSRTWPAPAPP
jgi:ABC-type sulfate/molybdate transport systems ATPase subunit